MNAVEVMNLVKTYGKMTALRDTNLEVPEGYIFGLVGPNGAGKSTLIKVLVGALRPTSGAASVLGLDPLRERSELREHLGYMPQTPALYDDLSVRANVRFFGSAHVVDNLDKRVGEVLGFTELGSRANTPVYALSGGMQRRVALACALVHAPRILFLDEPTAAVDPYLRARFWDAFRELAQRGITLFISTHLMDEALLCDQVAVLRGGQVIAQDAPRRLLQRGRAHLTVELDGRRREAMIGSTPEDLAAALHPFGLTHGVTAVDVQVPTLEDVILLMIAQEASR